MTPEQMEQKIEFIIEQQAQFTVDIQQLKELHAQAGTRTARLEEFLFQLAQSSDARTEALTQAQIRTEGSVSLLSQNMVDLSQKMAELAEAQAHTEQRLNALIDIVSEGRNGKSKG